MRSLHALLVAVLVLVAVAATLPAGTDGAWAPIPARDLNGVVVQQVGRFAVLVHDITRRASLVFVKVERGETERPAAGGVGTNYRLVVTVEKAPGGSRRQYECVVWGVPGSRTSTWKLLGFKAL
ncbi:uncharacterized protein LOC123447080 [Hordeum vulgare subsp. vulgare]|uniref:Cystatin domain-containing protein n=1 Tax=Hordeum vulgare subsp. vulgare TaxID=112509 RepID=A0A8I6XTF8_HORVV|nr:uncharacterized protein LOC123447080 [Hordeum vulgare subsp. vulgare]KAI4992729.1 hypothetical protein ZWY2020_007042 [Hordeum vulgare]